MLKKIFMALCALALTLTLAGCATYIPAGAIYIDGKSGVGANNGVSGSKTGQACMNSILGLVAYGDAGIDTAMVNGGIKNVATVNYTAKNILGIYGTYCLVVTGN